MIEVVVAICWSVGVVLVSKGGVGGGGERGDRGREGGGEEDKDGEENTGGYKERICVWWENVISVGVLVKSGLRLGFSVCIHKGNEHKPTLTDTQRKQKSRPTLKRNL